ncbi:restriction endonuclease subunit S [Escherichia coli]|uniref:restriction endonuclease subunit S n=1 Tax=Escherichia coli TaxID=562 RepID=UPI000B7C846D|nr:restriction endonuclease subunit S [Escherichia coli]EFB6708022.1 restriction endonuclease subunit S [Escherichia coli]EFH7783729.1 restriction endonuclease subunit S [Escherichia coli]EHH5106621.1 restriction endonuclease subunit S [Escherichia coli]EJF1937892.1 restriction endonuclease subunit S [Escherichia coli]ELO4831241.1 restriction endonuclease subunit S [Escherichia coli]
MSFELYEYKIEDLGKVITGKTPPSKISDAFSAQGIPFVTPKDMDGRRLIDKTERYLSSQGVEAVRNCLLPQNSIAVSCIGSDMGKTVLLPGESITNQQINAIVVDSEHFDYKYVYYYLSTLQDDFKAIAGGSATPILNKGHFSQFKVSLPVKPVQNKIALILDSLDTKIEVNTEINHTLEQMAQALFKSWFVDFEPVKAKMAVLESGGSQADAMLAAMTAISGKDADALAVFEREHPEQYAELKATAELFPSAMRESELGEIPEGWYQTLLSELTGFLNGYAFKSKDWRETGFPVVKIGSVKPGFVDLKNCSYIDGIGIKNLERFEVFSGDILVGMTGYPGETGIIPETMQRVYLNQRVGKFTPLFEFLYSYVYTLVRNNNFKIYVSGQAHGSAQANISSNDILQYPVVKPNDALLRAFDVVVRNLISLKLKNQAQIQSLEQLRDTLLPKLLSGEITLPEAEQAVSEVENV